LIDLNDAPPVLSIIGPFKDHIRQTGQDDRHRDDQNKRVKDIIRFHLIARGMAAGKDQAQNIALAISRPYQ
jgi:hypothetical protein